MSEYYNSDDESPNELPEVNFTLKTFPFESRNATITRSNL